MQERSKQHMNRTREVRKQRNQSNASFHLASIVCDRDCEVVENAALLSLFALTFPYCHAFPTVVGSLIPLSIMDCSIIPLNCSGDNRAISGCFDIIEEMNSLNAVRESFDLINTKPSSSSAGSRAAAGADWSSSEARSGCCNEQTRGKSQHRSHTHIYRSQFISRWTDRYDIPPICL